MTIAHTMKKQPLASRVTKGGSRPTTRRPLDTTADTIDELRALKPSSVKSVLTEFDDCRAVP
jgi:hypothetical protein